MIAPLVIGDSLTVGAAPYLPARWTVDGRTSRTSAQGLYRLRYKHRTDGRIVVWALGTNDSYSKFRLPRRADVVVTLYGSKSAKLLNGVIRHRLPARCIVRWAKWARRHPGHMSGVHADAAGYRARARLTVRTVKRCD